ncbi:hypothetical protein ZOSMA_767G00060 [Zostera marina]|uniref:Agenet domain-containing protein n=1 Tax=Zostera marina TaxID=29655 RepID=A0A0K9NRE5_ZOSMR|nr:hypothetical protein ZOSMA_767G00060 [Zostera marina]
MEEKMNPKFIAGDKVEVRNEDDGFRGSWYEATIYRSMPRVRRYTITYTTLLSDDNTQPLRETVDWNNVRPRPTPVIVSDAFKVGCEVEAYCNDGWWIGKVKDVVKSSDDGVGYRVWFPESKEEIEFRREEVREHLDWIAGVWRKSSINEKNEEIDDDDDGGGGGDSATKLSVGQQVEVSSEEEGLIGAWYTARLLEEDVGGKYLVEYRNIRTDDEKYFLRETVDSFHIRPSPPPGQSTTFKALEEVDALFQDGWWVGIIISTQEEEEDQNYYLVYFKQTNEVIKFSPSELRFHHEWIHGKWIQTSKVFFNCNTH